MRTPAQIRADERFRAKPENRAKKAEYDKRYNALHHDRIQERERLRNLTPRRKRQMKNKNLRLRFGITVEQYESLLEKQGGVCACCGEPPDMKSPKTQMLHVDHDHKTGKVRSLLCQGCNLGIGHFAESKEKLTRAIVYLELHESDGVL